ncbi:hypothetical protein [Rummeliibacillus suwonensis]|uniref:hypothetical protein n=1 Tax=Rummeliibacillus suwonensis TaxID=1306154 RepID=UPI001AAF27B0|nr:hypothetical protein [Rummeliibacillus suwonensis]MBO2536290.1 hypothetical protein [Rummeliibacillus suwonensis]
MVKKIEQYKNLVIEMNDTIAGLKADLVQKDTDIVTLKEQKKQYILTHWNERNNSPAIKDFDLQIKDLELEKQAIQDQIDIDKVKKFNLVKEHYDELNAERRALTETHNSTLDGMIEELFILKMQTMKLIDNIQVKRSELQAELNEITLVMGEDVTKFQLQKIENRVYSPDYYLYDLPEPVVIQSKEIDMLLGRGMGRGRLPDSYVQYKETGTVEFNGKTLGGTE